MLFFRMESLELVHCMIVSAFFASIRCPETCLIFFLFVQRTGDAPCTAEHGQLYGMAIDLEPVWKFKGIKFVFLQAMTNWANKKKVEQMNSKTMKKWNLQHVQGNVRKQLDKWNLTQISKTVTQRNSETVCALSPSELLVPEQKHAIIWRCHSKVCYLLWQLGDVKFGWIEFELILEPFQLFRRFRFVNLTESYKSKDLTFANAPAWHLNM